MNKSIHIIGGGTVFHVRNHFALSAPAYGQTAKILAHMCVDAEGNQPPKSATSVVASCLPLMDVRLHLSKMAMGSMSWSEVLHEEPNVFAGKTFESYDDLKKLTEEIVADGTTKIVFFNPAVVDFYTEGDDCGKYKERFQTAEGGFLLDLKPTPKILDTIRKKRKDIFLVAFKATCGATEQEQYLAGLNMLKRGSVNLVLANDTKTHVNMIITPEEATYDVTTDRRLALKNLVDMALQRSHLTFTQSTVIAGEPVGWTSDLIPQTLRTVVEHCIERGAYKPFRGATVGHFACRLDDQTFVTSKRKTNFNNLYETGMVKIKTDGPDTVLAYGAKPSVGGQSQRIVFSDHPGYDCIVHFHCELKTGSKVPVRSQREFECGSHQCGKNTSDGLLEFDGVKAVFLEKHGPNVVFSKDIDPRKVIKFIDDNFDLNTKTGGYQLPT